MRAWKCLFEVNVFNSQKAHWTKIVNIIQKVSIRQKVYKEMSLVTFAHTKSISGRMAVIKQSFGILITR